METKSKRNETKYMTCVDAASVMQLTVRRVQQMCKREEIPGAIKYKGTWMIPMDVCSQVRETTNGYCVKKKPLPIGVSDYKSATTEYYYVDKTLMIRDFLDSKPKVSLFTRPRRFGKTLNMDMLRVFFERSKEDTSIYFKDKLIWRCGKEYTDYQGRFPVIFLSFKDIKCVSFSETLANVANVIRTECRRHMELEDSRMLNEAERMLFRHLVYDELDKTDCQNSLRNLSQLLHRHHGEKTIIIIDEYDTPIQQGYMSDFYTEIILFMRNFFSGGLKDNSHLAYGFMTGILRVAKESIFSGLNNLKIYSLLDENYSPYFGFTKEEILSLLRYYNAVEKYKEVCMWYDGYLFADTEIFNPWSVINYISDSCNPKAFWQTTGSNEVIGEVLRQATQEVIADMQMLLRGGSVSTYIDTNVVYPEIHRNPYMVYSFLLMTGYLRVSVSYPQEDGNFMCDVAIPNREIAYVYKKEILDKNKQQSIAISINQAIFLQDTKRLQKLLEDFMIQTISGFDGASEAFYHGMMLGLCAILSTNYRIHSNRESGFGRFDIMLEPVSSHIPGFIFEFKYTKDKNENLDILAEEALKQIRDKKYATELYAADVQDVVNIGIAFRGKEAAVRRG